MTKVKCVLFDMDGVMIDTESQYDSFFKHAGERYNLGVEGFEEKIKGSTLESVIKRYFSGYSAQEIGRFRAEVDAFEANMDFPEIPGAIALVKELQSKGVKVGLVTSSSDSKMRGVYDKLHFDELFDTVVTANHVTNGKPDPECFLVGAQQLGVDPKDCIVFEDSFAGIEAGTAAGMIVVGMATTNTKESLVSRCHAVIADYKELTLEMLESLL